MTVFAYMLHRAGSRTAEMRLMDWGGTLLQGMQSDNIKFAEAEEMRNVLNE